MADIAFPHCPGRIEELHDLRFAESKAEEGFSHARAIAMPKTRRYRLSWGPVQPPVADDIAATYDLALGPVRTLEITPRAGVTLDVRFEPGSVRVRRESANRASVECNVVEAR